MSIHVAPGGDATLAARDRMRDQNLPLEQRFTNDFTDHDPAAGQPEGGAGIAWFWERFARAFDYQRDDVETIVASGFVTTISTISGTHIGEWNGWAATGRQFSIRNVQVLGFRDGLASDRWGATDEYGIAEQLGLVHPPR